ncbi:MAG: hypothetical protein K6F52_03510 [Clostridia bacterium]|nr:hypothetical protein [Clostridia bacterium]
MAINAAIIGKITKEDLSKKMKSFIEDAKNSIYFAAELNEDAKKCDFLLDASCDGQVLFTYKGSTSRILCDNPIDCIENTIFVLSEKSPLSITEDDFAEIVGPEGKYYGIKAPVKALAENKADMSGLEKVGKENQLLVHLDGDANMGETSAILGNIAKKIGNDDVVFSTRYTDFEPGMVDLSIWSKN